MLRRFNTRTMYDFQGEREVRRAAMPRPRAARNLGDLENPYDNPDIPEDAPVPQAGGAVADAGDNGVQQEDQQDGNEQGGIAFDADAVDAVLDLLEDNDINQLLNF